MALDSRIVMHANAKILEMIERSKLLSDQLIDEIPGVFAVITPKGEILRSNLGMAAAYNVQPDEVRGLSILQILDEVSAQRLAGVMSEALAVACTQQIELPARIALSQKDNAEVVKSRLVRFTVSPYGTGSRHNLLSVLGTDVTELRDNERRVSELYSLLPFGILSVNRDGKVAEVYSGFASWLLGVDDFAGQTFKTLILDRLSVPLGDGQRRAVESVFAGKAFPVAVFQAMESSMPRELVISTPLGDRVLGCQYLAVVMGSFVDKILCVFVDRSFEKQV